MKAFCTLQTFLFSFHGRENLKERKKDLCPIADIAEVKRYHCTH